jgi:hypothetical protein
MVSGREDVFVGGVPPVYRRIWVVSGYRRAAKEE